MNPRERFIAALERRPFTGRVPHFERVLFLTREAYGGRARTPLLEPKYSN